MDKKELYEHLGIKERDVENECICCGRTTWHAKKEDEELLCDGCYNGRQDIVEEMYSIFKEEYERKGGKRPCFQTIKERMYSVMREHKELFK